MTIREETPSPETQSSSRSDHTAHDRMEAQLALTQDRIHRFIRDLADAAEPVADTITEQAYALADVCLNLMSRVRDWDEVEVGLPTVVDDLGNAVDALEADLEVATSDQDHPDFAETLDRQVRRWRTRLDSLRLKGSLGLMEARDELDTLTHRLDHVRSAALVELRAAVDDSHDTVVDLREDVEDVLDDVRRAVGRAVKALSDD